MVESIDKPVHLVGHSSGAVCSLGAALLTDRLASLTLYEPPLVSGDSSVDTESIKKLVGEGKNEEAALAFLRQVPQIPEPELDRFRASPLWQHIVSLAPTMPPEFDAISTFDFDLSRFRTLDIPLLLLVGGDSGVRIRRLSEALLDIVPDVRLKELPGQQHGANLAAPSMFAAEVSAFVDEIEASRVGPARSMPGSTSTTAR